ncbi:cilia- and flagella-associated protein 144-like [Genypterus blacodes]|uniref:cilia- and flagella-associated protein 144-like n=1 Tax=Genypterus blacodes TaxID=154954 RepID=UPI003F770714
MAANLKGLTEVERDAIHKVMVQKLERNMEPYTGFFINPTQKLHLYTDKPMAKKEDMAALSEDSEFMQAYRRAQMVPMEKFSHPQTSSQVIGWVWLSPMPHDRRDKRKNFNRESTDVSKYLECLLRNGLKP